MSEAIHIKFRCRGCNKTSKVRATSLGLDFIVFQLSGSHANGRSDVTMMCPRCSDHVRLGFGRPWMVRQRSPNSPAVSPDTQAGDPASDPSPNPGQANPAAAEGPTEAAAGPNIQAERGGEAK